MVCAPDLTRMFSSPTPVAPATADVGIDKQACADYGRITDAAGNFSSVGQAACGGDAGDFAFFIQAEAVDRAIGRKSGPTPRPFQGFVIGIREGGAQFFERRFGGGTAQILFHGDPVVEASGGALRFLPNEPGGAGLFRH